MQTEEDVFCTEQKKKVENFSCSLGETYLDPRSMAGTLCANKIKKQKNKTKKNKKTGLKEAEMTKKDKKHQCFFFFFVFSLVYLVGGQPGVQYKHHVFQMYPSERIWVYKRYIYQDDTSKIENKTEALRYVDPQASLGSVFFSSVVTESRSTMYILMQVFKKFITSLFGHYYTFYFII